MSCMWNVKFHIGHLAPGIPDLTNPITKCMVMHPDTTFSDMYEEIAGCIKTMEGRALADDASTLVFAIRDNGSAKVG